MSSLSIIFILNGVFFISLFLIKNIFISLALTVFSFFIVLFIPWPKKTATVNATFSFLNLNFKNSQYAITVVCLIIFVVLEKFIGFNMALFSVFFIFSYFNRLNSRTGFFIGLTLLALTALLAAGGDTQGTENTATFAYYFLVIAAVWHIIELYREKLVVIFLACIVLFVIISGLILVHKKKSDSEKQPEMVLSTPEATPTTKPFKHIPFMILNGTKINGLAASTAATLRQLAWGEEFDMSIGNNETTVSANIMKYTRNLKTKKILLERNLNIQVTPIILYNASREAEMILILGK